MIFIQLVVCFLSPNHGSEIEMDKNHITSQTMGDTIYIRQLTGETVNVCEENKTFQTSIPPVVLLSF